MAGLAFFTGHTVAPVSSGSSAVASSAAMGEAWTLAEAAHGFVAARQPAAARARFQRAFGLSHDPTLLYELGRLEQELGHAARATHAFEQFLKLGAERAPAPKLQIAERQLQASAAQSARLSVQTNVVGAEVELEPERGVAVGEGFIVALLLDAGERRLSFSKPGYETRTLLLQLEGGEQRALRVDLDKAVGGRSETGSTKPRWTAIAAARPHHG
jgi:hypothetical protein